MKVFKILALLTLVFTTNSTFSAEITKEEGCSYFDLIAQDIVIQQQNGVSEKDQLNGEAITYMKSVNDLESVEMIASMIEYVYSTYEINPEIAYELSVQFGQEVNETCLEEFVED